jgi:predicted phosphate transport protein (TIGR00153 family)
VKKGIVSGREERMRLNFLPRETNFFDFFDQHIALTITGTQEFLKLIADGDDIESRAQRIKEIENETDIITHRCVEALHKTFITPLDRNDIHRLISRMDDVMDFVEAAAERIALYGLREIPPEIQDLAAVLARATVALQGAVNGLRGMEDAAAIRKKCIEVNSLENEADSILRNALARLFRTEKNAIQVIMWKEIYENLETATDRCEDVANIIEGVVLERE